MDFVVEWEGNVTPIEVKAAGRPRLADTAGLHAFLDEYPDLTRGGLLLHGGTALERLSERVLALPVAIALGLPGRRAG